MALTDEQYDAIIAAALKDAKAGKPSLLEQARTLRETMASRQQIDRAGIVKGSTNATEVTPSE